MNMRIYMDCLWNGGCELLIGTIASTYLPYIQIYPSDGVYIKKVKIYFNIITCNKYIIYKQYEVDKVI